MELFESIGLKADPFTTSPNPDLFFPAKEHKQCLEGLELAIRMRRGLSVVRGGIIVFDQINYDKFRGESLAFKDYFKSNKHKLKKFIHDPFVGYIIM